MQYKKVQQFFRKFPGRSRFGVYRFLPVFFLIGGAIEFCMIHWRVGDVNFYRTYKRKQIEELVEARLRLEREGITIPFEVRSAKNIISKYLLSHFLRSKK